MFISCFVNMLRIINNSWHSTNLKKSLVLSKQYHDKSTHIKQMPHQSKLSIKISKIKQDETVDASESRDMIGCARRAWPDPGTCVSYCLVIRAPPACADAATYRPRAIKRNYIFRLLYHRINWGSPRKHWMSLPQSPFTTSLTLPTRISKI